VAPTVIVSVPRGSTPIVSATVATPSDFVWVPRLGRAPPRALSSSTV